jgi:hypothetical protein
MPKSRGRKGKGKPPRHPTAPPIQNRQPPSAQPPATPGKSLGKIARAAWFLHWKAVVAGSVIVTIVAGFLFLWPPRVGVSSSGPFDASDPLSTSFSIKNTWVLPLDKVQASLGLCKFQVTPQLLFQGNCNQMGTVRIAVPKWNTPRYLDVDEQFSVVIADVFNTPAKEFAGGDITVAVNFRPWIVPITMERQFRFVANRQRDGKFYWTPEALNPN